MKTKAQNISKILSNTNSKSNIKSNTKSNTNSKSNSKSEIKSKVKSNSKSKVKLKVNSNSKSKVKSKTISKTNTNSVNFDKLQQIQIKNELKNTILNCLKLNYNTDKYGYIVLVGGEAINYYLPSNLQTDTSDFDIKFVVNPDFNSEDDLKKANIRRFNIMNKIINCLSNLHLDSCHTLYAKLGIKIKDKPVIIYQEGHKLFSVNKQTGEEKLYYYTLDKVFSIIIYYKINSEDPLKNFGILDMSLFYQKDHGYSFFATKIYKTYLQPPFNSKYPLPFIINDNIRIATLKHMLIDNFRMTLISLDNLFLLKDNLEKVAFWNNKIVKYQSRIILMLQLFSKNNSQNIIQQINNHMNDTFNTYQHLVEQNSICFRSDPTNSGRPPVYVDKLQSQIISCNLDYKKKIDKLNDQLLDFYTLVHKLHKYVS